jgi:hypothetical protein
VTHPPVQNILLTDDEVVAMAALLEQPWPTGLVTVDPSPHGLRDAALRGIRSLGVRGLLAGDPSGPDGFVIHPEIASVIEGFVTATRRIGAYLAPVQAPDSLAGASITAAAVEDRWYLDAATAQGVHSFRSASRLEMIDALADLAEKVSSGTLLTEADDPSCYACVIRYGTSADDKIVVAGGSGAATPWDRTPLLEVLAAART